MASEGVVLAQPGSGEKQGIPMIQQPSGFTTEGNIPQGLEYLATLDKVDIHQVLHLVEVLTGFEKNNQYRVCNQQDQEFLHAKEETECCMRQCCGQLREFNMFLSDMHGNKLVHLYRPLNCQGCCCPCCLQEMEINIGGNKMATIKEIWTFCVPRYEILDANNELIYRIQGDCCYCKCCTDVAFKIYRPDGQEAGEISKHWGGCREMFGQVNDFSISYANNETAVNKAILLGATFLVDFMFFEVKN